jgi:hypothetical protein
MLDHNPREFKEYIPKKANRLYKGATSRLAVDFRNFHLENVSPLERAKFEAIRGEDLIVTLREPDLATTNDPYEARMFSHLLVQTVPGQMEVKRMIRIDASSQLSEDWIRALPPMFRQAIVAIIVDSTWRDKRVEVFSDMRTGEVKEAKGHELLWRHCEALHEAYHRLVLTNNPGEAKPMLS